MDNLISTVDRFTRQLGPVNALVETFVDKVVAHGTAQACGCDCYADCGASWCGAPCSVGPCENGQRWVHRVHVFPKVIHYPGCQACGTCDSECQGYEAC